MVNDYLNKDIKVKSILKKYNLDVLPTQLLRYLPSVFVDEKCEYDNAQMLGKLNSRSFMGKFGLIDDLSIFCPICGHKSHSALCSCLNCQKHKKQKEQIHKKQILLRKKEEEKLNEKKIAILYEDAEQSKKFATNINDISLHDMLFITSYIRTFMDENLRFFKEFYKFNNKDNRIFPKYYMDADPDIDEIIKMYKKGYLYVSPESDLSSVNFNKNEDTDEMFFESFNPGLVKFCINIYDDSNDYYKLIDELRYPKIINFLSNKDFIYDTWKNIALFECKEYLLKELNDINFNYFKPGIKTDNVINHLLDHFSTSQIFGLIHNRVNNALRYYEGNNVPKNRAANSIITNLETYGERAISNHWDLTNYGRDFDIPQSKISEVFYNYILEISEQGFYSVPTKDI